MNDEDIKTALLEQIAEEINSIPRLLPDDITVPKLESMTDKTRCFIERLLKEKVKKGELKKVACYNPETGRAINAYRPA